MTFSYDLEKYKVILKGIFTRIKESEARALIIDLRSNAGGYSALGDELIAMCNAKPYKGYT